MRSAIKKLCQHGVQALRPQKVNDKWRKSAVSPRVAADLRKLAVRSGTYGNFDKETGIGWDPAWDAPTANNFATTINNNNSDDILDTILLTGSNPGKIASIRPPKETKRQRSRESRAQKIEALVAQADQKIEEYRLELESKKPDTGIETEFKIAMLKSKNK